MRAVAAGLLLGFRREWRTVSSFRFYIKAVLQGTLVPAGPWPSCRARLCRKALAFHSYACRTRGCISAFKGLPSPQRPRRALQMLSGTARSALASPAQLCLLLFKPASEKTKKLKVRVDLTHALKHFGHDPPPSGSLLILGACRRALSTLVDG